MGKEHLKSLKFKVASQVGVNLSDNYNGDITTKQAGLIGGNMVRELIATAEHNLSHNFTDNFTPSNWANTNATNWTDPTHHTWF